MPDDGADHSRDLTLARTLRDLCIERLRHDYEEAAIQGLCGEGAFEYAIDRLRHLPAEDLLAAARGDRNPPTHKGSDA